MGICVLPIWVRVPLVFLQLVTVLIVSPGYATFLDHLVYLPLIKSSSLPDDPNERNDSCEYPTRRRC